MRYRVRTASGVRVKCCIHILHLRNHSGNPAKQKIAKPSRQLLRFAPFSFHPGNRFANSDRVRKPLQA